MNINIALAPDDNYARHCAAVMASAISSAQDEDFLNFYILSGNLSDANEQKLKELCAGKNANVHILKIDETQFKGFPSSAYITVNTWYRFKISSLLPKETSRVLYLDCDTIVRESLRPLFELDFGGAYAAAVIDSWCSKFVERHGLGEGFNYFNAGVMLINLDRWRADNIEEKLFNFLSADKSRLKLLDQTVLNIVLKDRVKILPMSWNWQFIPPILEDGCMLAFKDEYLSAYKNPKIIHFVNDYKPWKAGLGALNPHWKSYFDALRQTPWKFESETEEYAFIAFSSATASKAWRKRLLRKFRRQPWFVFKKYWRENIILWNKMKDGKNA